MNNNRFFGLGVAAVALLFLAIGIFQIIEANPQRIGPTQVTSVETAPAKISYQGMLTEGGNPVNGSRNMVFKLFTTSDCSGAALATITENNVAVQDGLFHVALDVDPVHFNGQALWLQVEVGAIALGCEEVLPTPYTLFSASTGALHMRPVSAAAPSSNQILKWNGAAWAPAADNNTTYTAGAGLALASNQFSADFAGSGSATTLPRSDHDHFGQSWNGSATNGLQVANSSTSGRGVYGHAYSVTGAIAGIYGRADSGTGFGVAGHNYYNGTGVGAWSFSGRLIEGRSGDYPFGTLRFYVANNGQVWAQGGYITYVPSSETESNEYSGLYALQSPEAWFEDFGTGTLIEGKALVLIDPLFAATVNLHTDYHVFLTPMGNSNNLYVFNQTPTSFEVHEANDGQASISFHYRIVAKRQGYEDVRLETIFIEESVQLERQEVMPHD